MQNTPNIPNIYIYIPHFPSNFEICIKLNKKIQNLDKKFQNPKIWIPQLINKDNEAIEKNRTTVIPHNRRGSYKSCWDVYEHICSQGTFCHLSFLTK